MHVNRKDLQDLANVRLNEARALFASGFFDGAYYLAGYAVECALKACIAKRTRRYDFPDRRRVESSYSHVLADLLKVAGLEEERRARANVDLQFETNWDVAKAWSEQSRYSRNDRRAAEALLAAIADPRHGVLSWIKHRW